MENSKIIRAFLVSLVLALVGSTAFGVEFRAVNLKVLPPSAVVVAPQTALPAGLPAPVSSLINANQSLAAGVISQGPAVVLDAGSAVLMIPQTIRPGSQALVMPQGGGKAELVPITKEMASALREQVKTGDIAAAAKTLGHTFDASSVSAAAPSAAPVVAPQTSGQKAPESKLAHARTKTHGDDASGTAPPSPKADSGKPAWEKAAPLPEPIVVPSPLAKLEDGLEMAVSHSYPNNPGADPADWLVHDIDAYISFKGIKTEDKHFVLKYFEIGDQKVVDGVAKLVKAGIKTTILTDFNQSMQLDASKFPAHTEHSTDFESGSYKTGNPGKALKYLREQLGFKLKYGEGKFAVLSGVPFFNPNDKSEKPLMHDKGYVAAGVGGKAWEIAGNGTANMNATQEKSDGPLPSYGGRYNRFFRSHDQAANQVDWEHAQAEIQAYNDRTFSKGLPKELNAPRRVTYKNGEFREIAFTNGKQNPNDRIIAMLMKATQALTDAKAKGTQPDFELDEIIFSHFVLTDTPEVDALRKYLDALRAFYPNDYAKRVKVFGVFDQQFISPDGFGEAAALDGLLVQRPMGKSIFPFRTEYMQMMQLFGYIRLIDGTKTIDTDKAPTSVHLWHDKTTVIKAREKNPQGQMEAWTYAWSRSLNNSGHYQSLESQDMYRMRPDSPLAQKFEATIKEVAKAEPQYAIDLDKAIGVEVLAQITHHTRYDNGMVGYAEKAIDALVKKNYAVLQSVLEEVLALPTKNARAVDATAVKEKIAQFVGFMNWYDAQAKSDKTLNQMTYRKALNVGVGLISGGWGLRTALDIVFWGPSRGDAQMEALMKKAWTDGLKMDKPFPEPKSPGQTADKGDGSADTGA